jgi:hypothetical protein
MQGRTGLIESMISQGVLVTIWSRVNFCMRIQRLRANVRMTDRNLRKPKATKEKETKTLPKEAYVLGNVKQVG